MKKVYNVYFERRGPKRKAYALIGEFFASSIRDKPPGWEYYGKHGAVIFANYKAREERVSAYVSAKNIAKTLSEAKHLLIRKIIR